MKDELGTESGEIEKKEEKVEKKVEGVQDKLRFDNGDYNGETKDGIPHGYGILVTLEDSYVGQVRFPFGN